MKKIKLNEIVNRRIDNSLRVLENNEREVIKKVFIDKKSISRTSQELFKSRESVVKIIEKAARKIKLV